MELAPLLHVGSKIQATPHALRKTATSGSGGAVRWCPISLLAYPAEVTANKRCYSVCVCVCVCGWVGVFDWFV